MCTVLLVFKLRLNLFALYELVFHSNKLLREQKVLGKKSAKLSWIYMQMVYDFIKNVDFY